MKKLLLGAMLWAGLSGAVWAKSVEEILLASLESQGYVIIEQGYTFLGRLRIVAVNGEIRREIVIHPGTGEILRDYAVMLPRLAEEEPPTSKKRPTSAVASSDPDPDPGQTGPGSSVGVSGGVGVTAGVLGGDTPTQDIGNVTSPLDGSVVLDAIVVDPAFLIEAGQ